MYEELKKILDASRRIVFFGGAGVSTESGVPDFRSAEGLYNAKADYDRSPEEMLSYSFFRTHTDLFFDYYKKNLIYPLARPNKAHFALARLEEEGKLLGVITQNVDGLHQMAGSRNVYELHGSGQRNHCVRCNAFYTLDEVMDPANCINERREQTHTPFCRKCGGVVKPDVVLYEEALDEEVIKGAVDVLSRADTLIVGGTSLVVYPAAGLIRYFRGKPLVLINKSATQYDNQADLVIRDAIGEVLWGSMPDRTKK